MSWPASITWNFPWAPLPVLVPLAAALLLLLLRPVAWGRHIAVGAAMATIAATVALLWARPLPRLAMGAALLGAVLGIALALSLPAWAAREVAQFRLAASRAPRAMAGSQALIAALLLTLLAPDPVVAWAGLTGLVLALVLPLALAGEPATRARGRALLGIAAIGLLACLAGIVALALAWPAADTVLAWLGGAVVVLGAAVLGGVAHGAGRETATPGGDFAAFIVQFALLALALLLPPGMPMLLLGIGLLLAGAIAAIRAAAADAWIAAVTAVHAGLVLLALPGGAPRAAILLHLALLALTRAALAQGAFTAGLLALAALPPSGLFASAYLVVTGLPVPLAILALAALLLPLARLPLARLPRLLPLPAVPAPRAVAPGWVLLVLAALLGLATPPPLAAWLAALAAKAP